MNTLGIGSKQNPSILLEKNEYQKAVDGLTHKEKTDFKNTISSVIKDTKFDVMNALTLYTLDPVMNLLKLVGVDITEKTDNIKIRLLNKEDDTNYELIKNINNKIKISLANNVGLGMMADKLLKIEIGDQKYFMKICKYRRFFVRRSITEYKGLEYLNSIGVDIIKPIIAIKKTNYDLIVYPFVDKYITLHSIKKSDPILFEKLYNKYKTEIKPKIKDKKISDIKPENIFIDLQKDPENGKFTGTGKMYIFDPIYL